MASKLETLKANLEAAFGDRLQSITEALGQLTVVVKADKFTEVALQLRDDRSLGFEQLVDLCGMDYSAYGDGAYEGPRFASVLHLLSISNNWRVRVRVFAPDDDVPIVPSAVDVWSSANWYEREAFDLFGIVYEGHPDLRRILTDYGFIGHPFRKDFPLSGNVEVRYDPEKGRVVYQPVSIEPRTLVPKVIRHDNRYDPQLTNAKPNG
jgi:NADH-quinone oxidoreductase subunit C